jgi:tetratricopeptide (TPR) repeat protein
LGIEGRASASYGDNADAYNLYLQAGHLSARGTRESLEKAIGYYEQALKLDPGRAAYWAGLAAVHNRQASQGFVPVDDGFAKSREEVGKALALDPKMAEAHDILGFIRLTHDWDWEGADSSYRQAVRYGPGNAKVLGGAAALAGALGRFEEAIALYRRAIRLDPLNVVPHFNLGIDASYAGRLEEADAALREVLDLNPELPGAHTALGRIHLLRTKPEVALQEMEREKHDIWRCYGVALAYHALGRKNEADSALGELVGKYGKDAAFQAAEVYAFRQDAGKAMEWLERAYAQRDAGLAFLKGDPLLRNLEDDPRYRAFLRKMRLPV